MTRARAKRWARALGVLALFVLAFWLTGCDPAVFWARRGLCAHSGAKPSASATPSAVPVTDIRSVASSGATIADR